jgi:two-component system, cell cycle response regulator
MLPYPIPDSLRLSTSPPIAERPGRILVVDPDEQRRNLVRSMLDSEGYEAVYLADGDEALRLTSEYEPDLILLAVELPSGSGLELCGELRASDPRRHYPVLLLGDDGDEQSAARGLLAGADDFMAHPIREVELRARIRVQLRNKRFYDALERLRDERDSLRRDAQIDPLTNVLNRRSLEATVRQRCQLRERFGVLFLDLDHFKQVNDRFGHDSGDRVLIAVANVIKNGLRPGDIIGRYGGEEFVAIVAGAGPESARLVAERLRQAVEEMVPPTPGPSKVTISIGTTVFDPRQLEETPQELVHRADLALYAAKRGGRNRVVMVPPGETLPELEGKESLHPPPRAPVASPPEPPIVITWERHSG